MSNLGQTCISRSPLKEDLDILVSPFQDFGLDNLLAEQIFKYLDGPDFYVCLNVCKAWQSFTRHLLESKRMGQMIVQRLDDVIHRQWFDEDGWKISNVHRKFDNDFKSSINIEDTEVILSVKRKKTLNRYGRQVLEIIPKDRNGRLGHPLMVDLHSGKKEVTPAPIFTLVGQNIQIYRSYIFLLCYERTSTGRKVQLELQIRNKLTGTLLSEKVLRTRKKEVEPSFSDRMEIGLVLATLPHSNKVVVAKEPFVLSVFHVDERELTLGELYQINVPRQHQEHHLMLATDKTSLVITNYSWAFVYETSGSCFELVNTVTMPKIDWESKVERINKIRYSNKFLIFQVFNRIHRTSKLGILLVDPGISLASNQVSWLNLKVCHKFDKVFEVWGSRLVSVQSFGTRDTLWLSNLDELSSCLTEPNCPRFVSIPSVVLTIRKPGEKISSVFMTKTSICYDISRPFCTFIKCNRITIKPSGIELLRERIETKRQTFKILLSKIASCFLQ